MKLKFIIDKEYDKKYFNGKQQTQYLEKQYNLFSKNIKYSQIEYQKKWNEINDDFSRYIEKETGYKWFYRTYYCVVSAVFIGISNWGNEPKIVRWWRENPYTQRRITAYELIISHYFEIYKRFYQKSHPLKKNQVWALAEIAAIALTTLPPETEKFWGWDDLGYNAKHNYPQIVALQKKLKPIFLRKKNFDEYILKGIELVRSYPRIKP